MRIAVILILGTLLWVATTALWFVAFVYELTVDSARYIRGAL